MKTQTCCFTGHRQIPPQQNLKIYKCLKAEITNSIENGVVNFVTGGALGFDTLAAQAVLELRQRYAHIKLQLILPCKNQTAKWRTADQIVYENIKKACNGYIYVSDLYTQGWMQKRNRRLVECSVYCICYLTEPFGGTAYTAFCQKERPENHQFGAENGKINDT